jgi:hypothetical protein
LRDAVGKTQVDIAKQFQIEANAGLLRFAADAARAVDRPARLKAGTLAAKETP